MGTMQWWRVHKCASICRYHCAQVSWINVGEAASMHLVSCILHRAILSAARGVECSMVEES